MSEQELRITTNHKDLVPEGWFYSDLNNYINIGRGFAFKSDDYRDQGVPVVRVTNIENSGQINLSNNVVFIEKDEAESYLNYKLEVGDVLIVMVGATVGKLAKVESRCADALLNQNMWRLTVKSRKKFSQEYLYHAIKPVVDEFLSTLQGSARGFLTQKDFSIAEILLPPLPEQQKIATILTSVDTVIEKTRAQIDKLKHLKTGMMQELLTQGIGHTEFKDTPVGRIPKAWEVTNLSSIVTPKGIQTGPFGSQLHSHEYIERGVPVIMPKDMKGNKIDSKSVAHISLNKAEELAKHRVKVGDLVFARRGDIGRFALVDESNEGWVCGTGCLKVCLQPSVNPEFIASYLTLTPVIEWLNTNAVGQTMLNLNTSILSELPVVLPPEHEQKTIGKAILSIEAKIAVAAAKLDSLLITKKALMQDLLTGKVRITTSNKTENTKPLPYS